MFLGIGSLLFLHYQNNAVVQSFGEEKITIFMYYILNQMLGGLRGFVTVGAIAAALSSTNSVLGFALALLAMAVVSYFWQRHLEVSLISFALGVMAFAYTGLLGIYFAVLFTKRGTQTLLPFALFWRFCNGSPFRVFYLDRV